MRCYVYSSNMCRTHEMLSMMYLPLEMPKMQAPISWSYLGWGIKIFRAKRDKKLEEAI